MANSPITTTVTPILFLAFANDRDSRVRYLPNLAEEADATMVR